MRRWLRDERSVKRGSGTRGAAVLECVLEIRAAALELLRVPGEMKTIDGVPQRVQACECGSLSLLHTSPFQQLHAVTAEIRALIALVEQASGREVSRNLEYELDIWNDHRKIFNLQWSYDDREIHLIRFNRGSWQQQLRAEVKRSGAPGQ